MAVSYRFDENGNQLMPEPKSISWLNEYIKSLIEEEVQLQDVYVLAEISNFKSHSTGHLYFTLKDEKSEIKAVMFRTYAYKLQFRPENGLKVLVHGRVGVYEKGGVYQLYVDAMQPDGIGSLYLAYEQLKKKLSDEGLFDESHKKALPRFPKKIGIITSPTGAAVRDIIKVSKRRCPFIKLVLFPSAVQGASAADELTRAVEYFNFDESVDLIIIGRGGGSIEDLWSFNDEGLARAIYASKIPVISAVGHEIDFTICDFVADVRAATPSHAAEIATPNVFDLKTSLDSYYKSMYSSIYHKIENYKTRVSALESNKVLKNPLILFDTKKMQLFTIAENMSNAILAKTNALKLELTRLSASLNALSPLAVLSRGYSAVFDSDNKVVKSIENIKINDEICLKMADGALKATVNSKEREGKENAC
jgi:exodeoxyribonuclease VII large subunit